MSTVVTYLSLNNGSTEREVEIAVATIRSNFFLLSNLQGIGSVDASRNPIKIPYPNKRPADLTYFNFRFAVFTVTVDILASDKTLSIEFSITNFFFLVTLFFHILPLELQDAVQLGSYIRFVYPHYFPLTRSITSDSLG